MYLLTGCTSRAITPPLQNVCMVNIGDIGGLSTEKGSISSPIPISDFEAPKTTAI